MKKRPVDGERAIPTHRESAEVAQPGDRAFHNPPSLVAPQRPTILRRGPHAILLVRADQLDPTAPQAIPQRIAVVALVGDHALRFLPRTARPMPPTYPDRREGRFREPDFCRGCRVKVVSQRNTL